MKSEATGEFQKLFLLEFTKELIRHSRGEIFELETILDEEKEEKKEKTIEVKKEVKNLIKKKNNFVMAPQIQRRQFKPLPKRQPVLRIPEPRLPQRLQYLQPTPTKVQIDLGKLNSYVANPIVRAIECNGPDTKIVIQTPSPKTTNTMLTKDEINQIIQTISQAARIPLHEGVNKIVAGQLILLAIISDVVDSKFIIKKMMSNPSPKRQF